MNTNTLFTEFSLHDTLVQSLNTIGFENASEIQKLTIEPILSGKDIFAQAETGSGKTGSFSIPLIEKILRKGIEVDNIAHIILSPTRELAQQTNKVIEQIGSSLKIKSACIIGGESFDKQKSFLEGRPHILVATPGRLCDLLNQKLIDLSGCSTVVFDEADRLFDMGFKKDIEFILKKIPVDRQIIMVSATSNQDVLRTAYRFHSEPLELKLNEDELLVDNIDHKVAMLSSKEKMPLLVNLLRKNQDTYALVFCNTQVQTHIVAEWLKDMGFKAMPISGRLPQKKRTKLMEEFRSREVTILVCTDVAARGLDIKDVNLVINYDLPQEAPNYVHRIGRTGRAGKTGEAISFCAHEDCEHIDAITALIDKSIPKMNLTNDDFAKDLSRKPFIDYKTLKVVNKNKDFEKTDHEDSEPLAPIKRTEFHPYVKSQRQNGKPNSRIFIYTTTSEKEAITAALGYFQILDKTLLNSEVLKKGMPKFLLFGPRKTQYKFTVNAIYKKILHPFLLEIIKLSRLDMSPRVSFNSGTIRISFTGRDAKMLGRNKNELLYALETLCRLHLANKIFIPKNLKFSLSYGDTNKEEKELFRLVDKMKKKVLSSKKSVMLKPMNPAERRLVHQYLDKDKKVKTDSVGEGRFKQVEIRLR